MSSIFQAALRHLQKQQKPTHCGKKYHNIKCKYFNTKGGCFRGNSCWYSHHTSSYNDNDNDNKMEPSMDIMYMVLVKLDLIETALNELKSFKPIILELIEQKNEEKYQNEQQKLVQECLELQRQEETIQLKEQVDEKDFKEPPPIAKDINNKKLKYEKLKDNLKEKINENKRTQQTKQINENSKRKTQSKALKKDKNKKLNTSPSENKKFNAHNNNKKIKNKQTNKKKTKNKNDSNEFKKEHKYIISKCSIYYKFDETRNENNDMTKDLILKKLKEKWPKETLTLRRKGNVKDKSKEITDEIMLTTSIDLDIEDMQYNENFNFIGGQLIIWNNYK